MTLDHSLAGDHPPFEPERFSSTVPFYLSHRLRYPPRLIDAVAAGTRLQRQGRVLDLGCGPGFLAIAFAALAGEVIGVDPDKAMLDVARSEAAAAGGTAQWLVGSSFDLPPGLGRFDLVVMGRSFHWMDRSATLAALDLIVAPGGSIALFADRHDKTRENAWHATMRAVADEFSPDHDFSKLRRSGRWDSHAAVLLNSPFRDVEALGVFERRDLTADDIVGRALSMSNTAPHVLGTRRALFEDHLRRDLATLAPDGRFTEVVEYEALLARR